MTRAHHARNVARNALSGYAQYGVSFLVQLFLIPFILGRVGHDEYGLWALAFSALGFFTLLDFGLGPGVVKYVARCTGSGDLAFRDRMLSTVLMVYLALAALALAAVLGLSLVYGPLFDLPASSQGRATLVLLILSARTWGLVLPLGLFRGVLFGAQHIPAINAIQIACTLLLAGGTWLTLTNGGGVVGMAWVNLGAAALEHLAYVVAARRLVPDLRLSWRLFDRSLLGEAASFGLFQFLVSVSALVLLRTGVLIVQLFLSLGAVTLYAIPLKICEYAILLIKPFVNVLTPVAAQMRGAGDEEGLKRLLVTGSRVALVPAATLAAGAWALGREVLVLWVGPEFAPTAPVLITLMSALVLSTPQMVVSGVFAMTERHRFTAGAAVAAMVVNLGTSLVLVRPLGILGVACGTLAAALLVDGVGVMAAAARSLGMSYQALAVRVYLPALVPAAVQYGVTRLVAAWVPVTGPGTLLLAGTPGVLAGLTVLWLVFVDADERMLIRGLLQRRVGRPAVVDTVTPEP
jgi:O-antigen/teichoic acid export membrane protein